jgi:2-dehydropantoate 2-reductase
LTADSYFLFGFVPWLGMEVKMKIAVLGAGAMGSIFGGRLSQRHEVWLIAIRQELVAAIRKNGLLIEEHGRMLCYHPQATTNGREPGPVDLVIVLVKSSDTAAAVSQNRELFGPHTAVLTLQNGWGNAEDILQYVSEENLYLGTTAHGGNVLGLGKVCHAGEGQTFVGVRSGSPERAQAIADILTESGFKTYVSDNVIAMIWKKLLINAAINPLTALLNVRNGYLTESGVAMELMEKIVRDFNPAVMVAEVKKVARLTGANRSSMLQDVTAKRRTEIDRINGAIVSRGEAAGIATPYNAMLLQLIKALEGTYSVES